MVSGTLVEFRRKWQLPHQLVGNAWFMDCKPVGIALAGLPLGSHVANPFSWVKA